MTTEPVLIFQVMDLLSASVPYLFSVRTRHVFKMFTPEFRCAYFVAAN